MKQQNEQQENFLDTRTLVAVVLVGLVFMGWQMYLQKKYPQPTKPAVATEGKEISGQSPTQSKSAAVDGAATPAPEGKVRPAVQAEAETAEKLMHYQSENFAFDISSHGMGLKAIHLLKYKTRDGRTVVMGTPDEGSLPMETRVAGQTQPLNFKIEKVNDNLFVGRANAGGVQITKTMQIDPEKYVLDYKIETSGSDPKFTGVTTTLIEDVEPESSLSALNPRRQMQEFYVEASDNKDRTHFSTDDVKKNWSKVRLASVGSQYFTQVIMDKSEVLPDAAGVLNHAGKSAGITLQYPVLNPGAGMQLAYTAFIGPKSLSLIRQVDDHLAHVVDFGYFEWIGKNIMSLLVWFHGISGNWGWAIVLLTCFVRLVVLPANIYSFKSMRKMQDIQPQLKELRERYKDDQQKQQQATLALMKEAKVNPLSGCLPILLQLPIFWALYQVLGNCIELYQAPWVLWIHDLSIKDPFYILPVVMGVTMFVQQKLTPNTMDPAQAKVMLMMPLVFTFFMASLPSGLTLYMLIGAIFSVAQQFYFIKQPKTLSSGSKA